MATVTKTPIAWNLERLICECGGEFKSTGIVLDSYPPQYPLRCDKCRAGETRDERYPRVAWDEVPTVSPADETQRKP